MRYTLVEMLNKRLAALAFGLHAVIGSFCMMPMAHAMAAEQAMPSMSAIHKDCDDCPQEDHDSEKKMLCASGHCISAHAPEGLVSSSVTVNMRSPAVTNSLPIAAPEPTFDQPSWQLTAEGPPPETGIHTIVLRQ
jgi:hypothetical protein